MKRVDLLWDEDTNGLFRATTRGTEQVSIALDQESKRVGTMRLSVWGIDVPSPNGVKDFSKAKVSCIITENDLDTSKLWNFSAAYEGSIGGSFGIGDEKNLFSVASLSGQSASVIFTASRDGYANCVATCKVTNLGEIGQYIIYAFKRAPAMPLTPSGLNPPGWSNVIPDGTDPLFSTYAVLHANGTLKADWVAPIVADAAVISRISDAFTAALQAQQGAEEYADNINATLQAQIDGVVMNWFYNGVPTMENAPASTWTDDATRTKHLGDVYYDKSTGYAYRFQSDSGSFGWLKIVDQDITSALEAASTAQTTADGKSATFLSLALAQASAENGDSFVESGLLYLCTADKAASYVRLTPKAWGILASAPTSGMITNDTYYNSGNNTLYYYNVSAWIATTYAVVDGATGPQGIQGIPGTPGAAAISYSIDPGIAAFSKARTGILSPASITINAKKSTGGTIAAYAGRFIIVESTDGGATWTNKYTSSANESTKVYSPTSGISALGVTLYEAGGTTIQLAQLILCAVPDGSTAPLYWGALSAAPTANLAPDDYYFDNNTPANGGGVIRYRSGQNWDQATAAWAGYYDAWARASTDAFSWSTTSHKELEQATKLATAVARAISDKQVVSALPANPYTGYVAGDIVVLTTDHKLYRLADANAAGTTGWTTAVVTADLSGTIADAQIAGLAASKVTGQLSDAQIAAVTAAKLTGQITTTQITDDAITTAKIAAGAVTATEIAADSVTADKIAAGAVTASELAAGAVTTAKLVAGAVTTNELAAGAVTAAKIAAGTITTNELAADSVTAAKIAAGAIGADEIAANAVTAAKILAGTITATQINTANLGADTALINSIVGQSAFFETLASKQIYSALKCSDGTPRVVLDLVNSIFKLYSPSKDYAIEMANGALNLFGGTGATRRSLSLSQDTITWNNAPTPGGTSLKGKMRRSSFYDDRIYLDGGFAIPVENASFFKTGIPVSANASETLAAIVDGNDTIHLFYCNYTGDRSDLCIYQKTRAGSSSSWSAPVKITGSTGDANPGICIADLGIGTGRYHLIYTVSVSESVSKIVEQTSNDLITWTAAVMLIASCDSRTRPALMYCSFWDEPNGTDFYTLIYTSTAGRLTCDLALGWSGEGWAAPDFEYGRYLEDFTGYNAWIGADSNLYYDDGNSVIRSLTLVQDCSRQDSTWIDNGIVVSGGRYPFDFYHPTIGWAFCYTSTSNGDFILRVGGPSGPPIDLGPIGGFGSAVMRPDSSLSLFLGAYPQIVEYRSDCFAPIGAGIKRFSGNDIQGDCIRIPLGPNYGLQLVFFRGARTGGTAYTFEKAFYGVPTPFDFRSSAGSVSAFSALSAVGYTLATTGADYTLAFYGHYTE